MTFSEPLCLYEQSSPKIYMLSYYVTLCLNLAVMKFYFK